MFTHMKSLYRDHKITFHNKYRLLYSSVPTDDNELCEIHDVINSRLATSTHITVTPDIIKQCIH